MSSKKKSRRLPTPAVAVISVAIALAAAAFSWWQLTGYENNLLEIFAKQQDQYVQLAVDQINREADRTDEDIVENVLGSISGSSSQYWTLSKKNSLIFVKDVTDSSRYRGFSSKTYYRTHSAEAFIAGLSRGRVDHAIIDIDGREFIASGSKFSYNGHTYRLCLLTGKHVVIDQNAYLAARVNLGVTIGAVLVIFVGACIGMSLRNDAIARRLRTAEAEALGLRHTVEDLNRQIMGRKRFDTARSLFALGEAPTFFGRLAAAEKYPANCVSLRFDSVSALDAFVDRARGVLDESVVRFARGSQLLLVFVGADPKTAEYALSLLGEKAMPAAADDNSGLEVEGVEDVRLAVRIEGAAAPRAVVLRRDVDWGCLAHALDLADGDMSAASEDA